MHPQCAPTSSLTSHVWLCLDHSKHFEEDIEEMTWDLADGGRLMPAYPNDKPSEFRIESNGKALHLQADTVEDRNRWCKAISTEVTLLQ
eukprot:COSAG05_NODE_261_length_12717_cov_4.824061_4_plen_89_part_00